MTRAGIDLDTARRVLAVEARAVETLADRIDERFEEAAKLVLRASGRVVLTGMGKSGIVARKIAATFASTGTPALFMHPAEAVHGDLGMIVGGDVVLALSQSGETDELVRLVEMIRRIDATLITMTGRLDSTLGREADVALHTGVDEEGCPLALAPMASTTATLALGDALAAVVMEARGFDEDDFARLHPGGRLGLRLRRVRDLMHWGDALPRVGEDATMSQVVVEMSRKRLGCTTVVDDRGTLVGIITDGDLRRLLERDDAPLTRRAGDVMTREPVTIGEDVLATAALRVMEERKITMIPVLDDAAALSGVIQIHDLWRTQMV